MNAQYGRLSARPVLVVVVAAILIANSATAQRSPLAKPTGIFGKLQYHKDSGDLVGLEVFITNTRRGYVATIQVSEGEPEVPVIVDVRLNGANVSFALPSGGRMLRFEGVIRPEGLSGRFDKGAFSDRPDGRILLARGASYWQ